MIEVIKYILDFVLNIDQHIVFLIQNYHTASFAILFLIIFMETGFVVTPFLPGDSLLFALGALAAVGLFNIVPVFFIMLLAAFLGDTVNFWAGRFVGPMAFKKNNKFFKKKYLDRAQKFYEKHGGKAIILARFVPFVRTFAPFVAGIGQMHYGKFFLYNFIGGFLWVLLFISAGFFFGNLPIVKQGLHYIIIAVILLSVAPFIFQYLREKRVKTE